MCVICYKPKKKELSKKEILQNCWNINSDGAGFMYTLDKKVVIKKGYMNFNKFYEELLKDYKKYNLKNKNLVLHFRIGTSGGITPQKTHPFVLSNSKNKMDKLKLKCESAVVHNGVLEDYIQNNKYSDTQNFISEFLCPIINSNLQENLKNKLIKKELKTSKLIILQNDDTVLKYGDFEKYQGCYFSNSSYKTIIYNNWNNWETYENDIKWYYDKNLDIWYNENDILEEENNYFDNFDYLEEHTKYSEVVE